MKIFHDFWNKAPFHPFLFYFYTFAIECYSYEKDLTLLPVKNIIFKSSYDLFKIDILSLLWPLIANE